MNKKNLEIKFYHKAFCRNSRKTNSNNWFSLKRTGRFSREIYTVRALISKSGEKQKPPPPLQKAMHEFWKISIHCELLGRRPRSVLDSSNKSEYAFITSWNAATHPPSQTEKQKRI